MNEGPRQIAAIMLAAGEGTRMKSDRHNVLHPIAGRAMIDHLLDSVGQLQPARTVVVVGQGREQLKAHLGGRAEVVVQDPQLGTAQAVQQAESMLAGFDGVALVLYADGRTTSEVARAMNVQYETAKTYLRRVREKYGKVGRPTSSRADLIRRAAEDGYLT